MNLSKLLIKCTFGFSVTVGLLADIGTDNFAPQSLQAVQEDSTLDLVIAAGDLAYADTKLASTPESVWYRTELWDQFGRLVEGFGSKVPFVTTIGNHEVDYEINTQPVHYLNRFRPDTMDRWHSFSVGLVHFLSVDTNLVLTTRGGNDPLQETLVYEQLDWLENQLKQAVMQRHARPWIVVVTHIPLYSSGKYGSSANDFDYWRDYRNVLEPLMHKYKVDVVVSGNEHMYERTYPTLKLVPETRKTKVFKNPCCPVYVVSGNVGRPTFNTGRWSRSPIWSAYRTENRRDNAAFLVGYARIKVERSSLVVEYVGSSTGNVMDSATLLKSSELYLHRHTLITRGSDKWMLQGLPLGNTAGSNSSKEWKQVITPAGYGETEITLYGGTEVAYSDSYLYRHSFYLPCVLQQSNRFTLSLASDDGALVVVNGHVVLDKYGQKQRWKPESHYWTDSNIKIPLDFMRFGGTNVVAAHIYNKVHSKSHVWDLELEAMIPVEYVDELYGNDTQHSHRSCSPGESNIVTIQYNQATTSQAILRNPERGLSTRSIADSKDFSPLDKSSLIALMQQGIVLLHRLYVLNAFTHTRLSKEFLSALERDFATVRTVGMRVMVGFCYCLIEPCSTISSNQTFQLIEQLQLVLVANSDVLFGLEARFLGPTGNCQDPTLMADSHVIVRKLLIALPVKQSVMFQTVKQLEMVMMQLESDPRCVTSFLCNSTRLGLHSDIIIRDGRYTVAAVAGKEAAFFPFAYNHSIFSVTGGHLTMNSIRNDYSAWNGVDCKRLLEDLKLLHFTYVVVSSHQVFQMSPCLVRLGQSVGYRLSLVEGRFTNMLQQRGQFWMKLVMKNEGFSAPVTCWLGQIVMKHKHSNTYCIGNTSADSRLWYGQGRLHVIEASLHLPPETLPTGEWELYFSLGDMNAYANEWQVHQLLFSNGGGRETKTRLNRLLHVVRLIHSTAKPQHTALQTATQFQCYTDRKGSLMYGS